MERDLYPGKHACRVPHPRIAGLRSRPVLVQARRTAGAMLDRSSVPPKPIVVESGRWGMVVRIQPTAYNVQPGGRGSRPRTTMYYGIMCRATFSAASEHAPYLSSLVSILRTYVPLRRTLNVTSRWNQHEYEGRLGLGLGKAASIALCDLSLSLVIVIIIIII